MLRFLLATLYVVLMYYTASAYRSCFVVRSNNNDATGFRCVQVCPVAPSRNSNAQFITFISLPKFTQVYPSLAVPAHANCRLLWVGYYKYVIYQPTLTRDYVQNYLLNSNLLWEKRQTGFRLDAIHRFRFDPTFPTFPDRIVITFQKTWLPITIIWL